MHFFPFANLPLLCQQGALLSGCKWVNRCKFNKIGKRFINIRTLIVLRIISRV